MSALGDILDARYWDAWLADHATARAFEDPRPGDRFSEMLSFWVYVVARRDRVVVTHEFCGHPSEYEGDAVTVTERIYSLSGFASAFRYATRPGYCMRYCDRAGPRLEMRRDSEAGP